MEHAHPIDRTFSWRGVTLTRPALLMMIALVAVSAWALLHGGTPTAAQKTQAPPRARSATSVLVLNGAGISGAAGHVSNRLLAHGYRSSLAADARVTTYARSLVLYRRGWQSEAERLAKDTHIRAVAPLDGPLPAASAGFPLVLILGR